ncbi:MAG: hypothetical protein UR34_C0002G0076 [candidate division WS6 bacterium GW2011_GWC1_33_20]|uniref:N-acetylmuramoyl-L-alanine amidase family 2 n=2 Tax=Candidatus Dojkabacteria TaxID=74243 RepID=A0A0G0ATE8_9BACT|nr:MAG: hypothetical protein UR32_C0005G0002 [candidate division WS6 bacterium GW2011_GWE2_33_157]KKP44573.1 MAG: hypothetical protein UR34_C0002G0076 [candidate division WS6 bacterium GW2011_GWC1_33_20]KKP46117.1 MAG: hypothetical protein UR36_C0001G0009 [candidate division WS6 bacterium GW2011_GWF1_33_233]KKP54187.1 MAG: hypothetical protein UR45_C0023G0003 [candidate division WS6 bacterium GW2011_WS6_33_547]KKP54671.1 MAG: N-acetylmuramoyl-L-alanine amidase family 2 [candidate division WS6 b
MKILRYTTTLILLTIFFSFLTKDSYAVEIISRESMKMDNTLSEQVDVFSLPQKIYIAQVEGYNRELNDNPQQWVKLLYYFSVTRLNLNDIPYNYLIDSSGNVYEGAKGGFGVNPGLENGDNVILIGIMDDSPSLSPRASSTLKEFVEETSYKYGIKQGSWEFVDLKIKNNVDSFSYITATPSQKSLRSSLVSSLEEVVWSDTEHLSYKGSIESVEYTKDVVIGQTLKVKVKIRNESDFTWFGEPNYIYISTKDSVESQFAINSVWESFSKPTHIPQKAIKVGDIAEVNFELLAKSRPNTYKESFLFMKSEENVIENSAFDVEFNIIAGENKLVEMISPEFGFVNIRECRWYSCAKVEVANEGDVFITTNKVDGWYEILYQGDKKGWVYQKYAREL